MNVADQPQAYPPLSLKSLQGSPNASRLVTTFYGKITEQSPIFKTSMSQNSTPKKNPLRQSEQYFLSSKVKAGPETVSVRPESSVSISSISKGKPSQDQFFQKLDDIRGVRMKSEMKLQQTLENLAKVEQEPREKLKWKTMLQTGQYIGSRGLEKKDIRLSGRAMSKEKGFQEMRTKIKQLKYEIDNPNVVKHLTSKETPDSSVLAQPQLLSIDFKPIGPKTEIAPIPDMSQLSFKEMKKELGRLHFDIYDSPTIGKSDAMIEYNLEQIKKLKGGINRVHKWITRNKDKETPQTSTREPEPTGVPAESLKETQYEKRGKIEDRTEDDSTNYTAPLFVCGSSRKKEKAKKRMIEDRIKKPEQQENIFEMLGITAFSGIKSAKASTKASRPSFFLTSEGGGMPGLSPLIRSPMKEERSQDMEGQSLTSAGIKISEVDQNGNSYFLPQKFSTFSKQRVLDSRLSSSEVMKSFHEGDSTMKEPGKESLLMLSSNSLKHRRFGLANKSEHSAKKWNSMTKGKLVIKRDTSETSVRSKTDLEKQDIRKRYNQLSIDCDNHVKFGTEIQHNLERGFEELNGKLEKLGWVQKEDWFIDHQIKEDIYSDMHNSGSVASKLSKRPQTKSVGLETKK